MNAEPDLFQYGYPNVAGFKRFGTSSEAAQSIDAKTLRAKVLEELCKAPGTADELAYRLHVDRLSIRPRCSELAALGQIEDSGIRHENSSGRRAVVWQVRALDLAA